MFTHDEILIIGDSFAYERKDPKSWMRKLILELVGVDTTARGEGFPGCSWWSVRVKLLQELKYKVPKLLIITHTEPMRLPSNYDFPLNSASVENLERHIYETNPNFNLYSSEVKQAGKYYYKYLFFPEYHMWANEQWNHELDAILDEHKIPYVIHLKCFPDWPQQQNFIFRNGLTAVERLEPFTQENKNCRNKIVDKNLNVVNHMTDEENTILKNAIINAIKNYSNGEREIGLKV